MDQASERSDDPAVSVGHFGHRVRVRHSRDGLSGGAGDRRIYGYVNHGMVAIDVGDCADVHM